MADGKSEYLINHKKGDGPKCLPGGAIGRFVKGSTAARPQEFNLINESLAIAANSRASTAPQDACILDRRTKALPSSY